MEHFSAFTKKVCKLEVLQNMSHMLSVSLFMGEKNEIVVKVNKHKLIQHITKHIINKILKDCWVKQKGITKYSKRLLGLLKAVCHLTPSEMLTKW